MIAERPQSARVSLAIDCPVLVTERLVLRPLHEHDIAELRQLADNRRVATMLARMPYPYTIEDARAFVAMSGAEQAEGRSYALTLAESGAFIGCAGLDAKEGRLELGYWIGEPFWGRGYASEAAHALVDLAFRTTDIERLDVSCRLTNAASRRVIHKAGFHYSGQAGMNSLAAGPVAIERYELERADWIALRSRGGGELKRRAHG